MRTALALTVAGLAVSSASANIRISEWMYQGVDLEYIEIVNLGPDPISLSGWSYDDADRVPGAMDLSSLGTLLPNQAAVIAEATAAAFRSAWGLGANHKVIGENTNNLSRNDEINIFDGGGNLVDRLTYGDQNFAGTIRTQNKSGWNIPSGAGPWGNVTAAWKLSIVADAQGSWTSVSGDIGSPCVFVPAPGSAALMVLAVVAAGRRRR